MLDYIKSWSLFRLLRLGIGLLILGQGILVKDYLFIGFGIWMAALPLLNVGCGCTPRIDTSDSGEIDSTNDVIFEEVK